MFTLSLVTPEKKLITDLEIDEVLVPGYRGQLDILPGHAPLLTTLLTGLLKYRAKGSATLETVVVSWGYCEVHPAGVVVLAEIAESLEEIDRQRAEEQLKHATKMLLDPLLPSNQIEEFRHKEERALARLEALGIHGGSTTSH
jgi:F-type H+-transporting ATPase subunit epsilon